mmetsp:Transcript_43072/g.108259  ORF Transcript_43072/g.108259 Transcript_43072/m.108259 type:complete len:400 (-) Transcript_43072:1139-2338(-)
MRPSRRAVTAAPPLAQGIGSHRGELPQGLPPEQRRLLRRRASRCRGRSSVCHRGRPFGREGLFQSAPTPALPARKWQGRSLRLRRQLRQGRRLQRRLPCQATQLLACVVAKSGFTMEEQDLIDAGLIQRPPLVWSESRPVLMAFIFRHWGERAKHPEVVLSCLLQAWRAQKSMARWQESRTDLTRKDMEVNLPPVLDSRISAASFACVEQLGVDPPPSKGWKPLPQKGEDSSPKAAEWLRSTLSADWIYHTQEETYFHLPTSTLWEQREVKCVDPKAPAHSYFRVDAFHLQALAHFAQNVDSGLVPLAWQAWVRYTRKRIASRLAELAKSQEPAGDMDQNSSMITRENRKSSDVGEEPVVVGLSTEVEAAAAPPPPRPRSTIRPQQVPPPRHSTFDFRE